MYYKLGLSLALALMSGNVMAEEIQTSGICGKTAADCSWSYEDGKLTITGSGEMSNYSNLDDRPWHQWQNDITNIELSDITHIGDRAFYYFGKVENITIPASVKRLGNNAFVYMNSLESVTFEQGSELTVLDWGVFAYDSKLKTLEIPETVKYISAYEIGGTAVKNLVLPKGIFEEGGTIDYRALQSNMTIYCPKEHQQECEDYVKTAEGLNVVDGKDIYSALENLRIQTYEKDGDGYFIGGKWYKHPNDVLTGKHIKKLRYTIEEAMKATEHGDKFHVSLTYK